MSHADITLMFLALAILLGSARLLGEFARALGQPSVLGEILAGILLGPTLLGRVAPEMQATLFPATGNVAVALQATFALAVSLFLLVAGLEVDLSMAFRQGRSAAFVCVFGMGLPFFSGLALAWFAPGLLMEVPEGKELVFALFYATAISVSALPVIAKILKDLNLLKSEMGVVILAAAIVNDLLGWMIFAMVLGMMGAGSGMPPWQTATLTLGFAVGMLTVGRWAINRAMPFLQARASWPGGVLGFAITLGLLCSAFTEWIGVHAIFGAFIFGIALGDSRHLRQQTRETLDHFISLIFAPLFFASIGLQVDFIGHFDLLAVVVVLANAMVCKVLGSVVGGKLSGRLQQRESWAIGFGLSASGAMGIILGLLAREYGVIDDEMFVAIVVMALATSMASGTLMQRALKRKATTSFRDLLSAKSFIKAMEAPDRRSAINELAASLSPGDGEKEKALALEIAEAAWARELVSATGLPHQVAIPHARVPGLAKPMVALGFSPHGVDFDAPDGRPAKVVFLIATPKEDKGAQLEVLASIGKTFREPAIVADLLCAASFTEALALFNVRSEMRKH
jgi:Kef-type K+ transport system membrane component KefB/mannitol/fructose-specific phosphotransferase system IIA component (Ntr-type)